MAYNIFKGLPLLDPDFARDELLEMVARARSERDSAKGLQPLDLDSYLNPVIAADVYKQPQDEYTSGACEAKANLVRLIEKARLTIRKILPEWQAYLSF